MSVTRPEFAADQQALAFGDVVLGQVVGHTGSFRRGSSTPILARLPVRLKWNRYPPAALGVAARRTGHRRTTFDVGVDGEDAGDGYEGGNDIWFSVEEAPDYSILPPSSGFVPDRNEERYDAWSTALDASPTWYGAEAASTHPDYVDAQFLLHDLGVFTLSEPIDLDEYGALPEVGYLDAYAGRAKATALFESVGYGLKDSSPKSSAGGDTRRKADRRLISFQGAYGLRDIAVKFSHSGARGANGGTCFGDSGGPTFDITGSPDGTGNVIVAVTSFGANLNCNASGSYRIDQLDDLAFIESIAG